MTRNDLILTLVRAGAAGDKALLRSTVEALAAEERAKRHTTLADRLTRAVQTNGQLAAATPLNGGVMPAKGGQEFLFETHPQRSLLELILSSVARREIENLIEEQFGADLLRSHVSNRAIVSFFRVRRATARLPLPKRRLRASACRC